LSDPGKPETKDICERASQAREHAMGEVEFDRLLDAVRVAIAPNSTSSAAFRLTRRPPRGLMTTIRFGR
jgi:hypothetical protein